MDKAIVDRAVRALAALNAGRSTETRPAPVPNRAPVTRAEESKCEPPAACGSPRCAGCYEVEPGRWIHPPKCGEDYRAWLEKWEPKGRLQ